MGLTPSKAQCAEADPKVTAEMLGGMMGGPVGGANPLAGLGAPPAESMGGGESMGGSEGGVGLGGLGLGAPGAPIAAIAATLPNPGKWEDAATDAEGVLNLQTYDGMEINYTKGISQSPLGQLMMAHAIKMGNPQTEGYELTTTYASQAVFAQGMTKSGFGLQGVAVFQEILPGLAFKFMPQFGLGPNGEINQAVFDLAYKGGDWSATAKCTPGAQTQAELTFNQQLSEHWSAGFKLDTLLLKPDYLPQHIVEPFGLADQPLIPIPQGFASLRYQSEACTAYGQIQMPFPGPPLLPGPWISTMVFGFPSMKLSYAHKIFAKTADPTGQTAPGPQVSLATDIELGLGPNLEIESTTRMGWNYQLRGANVKAMVDSTWKVKCFFETQMAPFPLSFVLTAEMDHGANAGVAMPGMPPPQPNKFGFGMNINV